MTASEPTYYVKLAFTVEGPFTREALRERLHSGKARSDDTLIDEAGRILTVTEVIAEAGDISRQRSAISDRIRRKSSDRHVAVEVARQAALANVPAESVARPRAAALLGDVPEERPTQVPGAESSAPAPVSAPDPVPAQVPVSVPMPARSSEPVRRRAVLAALVAVGVLGNWWLWLPSAPGPLPTLFQPPEIVPLTRAELAALPKERLVARVFDECTRRMYASHRGWRAGPAVLPPKACPLWVVGVLEPQLCFHGLSVCMEFERVPGTPSTPSLAQLAEAYRAIGVVDAAQILTEALALHVAAGAAPPDATDAVAAVQRRLTQALGTGSAALQIRYALAHRDELFPDLP